MCSGEVFSKLLQVKSPQWGDQSCFLEEQGWSCTYGVWGCAYAEVGAGRVRGEAS